MSHCEPGKVTDVRAYDLAVVKLLDPLLVSIDVGNFDAGDVSEGTRQHYVATVQGVVEAPPKFSGGDPTAPNVPIFFSFPEDSFQPFMLPCFVVKRGDLTPNFSRMPVLGQYRFPTCSATDVYAPLANGEIAHGYSEYTTRPFELPYDISYEISIKARIMADGLAMLQYALKRMRPPWFSVVVVDSIGDERYYDAGDINIADNSDIADIADRTIAWTMSFTVRADLDLLDDITDAVGSDPGPFLGTPYIYMRNVEEL